MERKRSFFFGIAAFVAGLLGIGLLPQLAQAHEAYVLTSNAFHAGLQVYSTDPFAGLLAGAHLKYFLIITGLVILSYLVILMLTTTKAYDWMEKGLYKIGLVGPLIIRLAISASFFYAAQSNVIFGPELGLSPLAGSQIIRFTLFLISLMILLGVFTELAAAVGLLIFAYVTAHYGWYMLTYANYFGELIVLFLFGSRFISIDRWTRGKERWLPVLEKYKWLEIPIVRILYGIALVYAGVSIKFLHQQLTIDVYNQYHLVNFFHASAAFIAAGAGLAEILIGSFILLGFMMRWTVLISLVFITISILYFRELLWPHLMLYGISLSLLINARDPWTVDHYAIPWADRIMERYVRRHMRWLAGTLSERWK
ncbi:DoxX family membrane protein [Patescibacteria group bacterium]|nr:DoxX family membrane protein [Patescibacteria group bacterium]